MQEGFFLLHILISVFVMAVMYTVSGTLQLEPKSKSSRIIGINHCLYWQTAPLRCISSYAETPLSQFDPLIIRLPSIIGQCGLFREWALPYHKNTFCPAQFGEINVVVSVF